MLLRCIICTPISVYPPLPIPALLLTSMAHPLSALPSCPALERLHCVLRPVLLPIASFLFICTCRPKYMFTPQALYVDLPRLPLYSCFTRRSTYA